MRQPLIHNRIRVCIFRGESCKNLLAWSRINWFKRRDAFVLRYCLLGEWRECWLLLDFLVIPTGAHMDKFLLPICRVRISLWRHWHLRLRWNRLRAIVSCTHWRSLLDSLLLGVLLLKIRLYKARLAPWRFKLGVLSLSLLLFVLGVAPFSCGLLLDDWISVIACV